MPKLFTIIFWISFIFFSSCNKSNQPVNLSYTKRQIIDSMFKAVLPELDSLSILKCEEKRQALLEKMVDSLYEVRMNEIQAIKHPSK